MTAFAPSRPARRGAVDAVKPARARTPRRVGAGYLSQSGARQRQRAAAVCAAITPQKTKESLERFYTDLAAVLTEQEKALVAVGEPPGRNAGRDYREMLTRLRMCRTQLTELKGRVSAADLKTADDLNDLLRCSVGACRRWRPTRDPSPTW